MESRLYDWLAMAGGRLRAAGIEEPDKFARYLAAHALQQDASWVLAHGEFVFPFEVLEPLLQRAENHEPLAYIRGYAHFDDHVFLIRPGVLIPRPETHHVVEAAEAFLANKPAQWQCLDLCCGSGCIGLSLALKTPQSWTLSDISERATDVADLNASRLKASVQIVQSDLGQAFPEVAFQLITCNPPYVEEKADLAQAIRDFEPPEALFAGVDGLSVYRRMAAELPRVMKPGGVLITEIGAGQTFSVIDLFGQAGWVHVRTVQDYAGIDRVLQFVSL